AEGADDEAAEGAAGVRSGATGFAATCAAGASPPAATAVRCGRFCSAISVCVRCLRRKETCCLVSDLASAFVSDFVWDLASLWEEADLVSDLVSVAAFLADTRLRGVAADLLE